jgi:small redox-active disulfide protein 2
MEIKILGAGCTRCRTLLAAVEQAVAECGIDAAVTKVDDIAEIMKYNVLRTPALVIDEKIVSEGVLLSGTEIGNLLTSLPFAE